MYYIIKRSTEKKMVSQIADPALAAFPVKGHVYDSGGPMAGVTVSEKRPHDAHAHRT